MTQIDRIDVFFSGRDVAVLNAKKAKISVFMVLKLFLEFSVFSVQVLNVKKCSEVTENCIQGNFLCFNPDTKYTEKSKKQFKHHKD